MAAKHNCSVGGNVLRRTVGPLAAVLALFATAGINRASADVSYNSYTWTGDTVTLTGPSPLSPINSETGGAGQIKLHLTTGQTLLAWCLDVFDWLQNSGTYSVTPNGPINGVSNPSNGGHIGGLMAEGNNLIQANNTLTVLGHTFSVQDESAATQIAIWAAEYGPGFAYNTAIMPTGFTDLVAYIDSHAGTSAYATLDPDPANCYTSGCPAGNQHLGYAVPGPLAGAGLPGLMAACAALIAFARRRRRALA